MAAKHCQRQFTMALPTYNSDSKIVSLDCNQTLPSNTHKNRLAHIILRQGGYK